MDHLPNTERTIDFLNSVITSDNSGEFWCKRDWHINIYNICMFKRNAHNIITFVSLILLFSACTGIEHSWLHIRLTFTSFWRSLTYDQEITDMNKLLRLAYLMMIVSSLFAQTPSTNDTSTRFVSLTVTSFRSDDTILMLVIGWYSKNKTQTMNEISLSVS